MKEGLNFFVSQISVKYNTLDKKGLFSKAINLVWFEDGKEVIKESVFVGGSITVETFAKYVEDMTKKFNENLSAYLTKKYLNEFKDGE